MTLEDTLTDLGNATFSTVLNYRAVLAYVNACFTKAGLPHVTGDTPSDQVLEQIYAMADVDLQTALLARPLKDQKPDNKFKKVLVTSGILISVLLTVVVLLSILGHGMITPEVMEILKEVAGGVFEVIKLLIGKT